MKILNLLSVVCLSVALTACGGGGSGSSGNTNTSTGNGGGATTPTFSLTKNAERCEINSTFEKCSALSFTSSQAGSGVNITTNAKTVIISANGSSSELPADGNITFSSTTNFEVYLVHDVVETVKVSIDDFIVDSTTHSVGESVDVEFYAPEANASINFTSLECGESSCTGTLITDTPIDGAQFTLDEGIVVTVTANEVDYNVVDGNVEFPATTQADVSFSISGKLSVQQVGRVTTNSLDAVSISGNLQEVNQSYELSFDRSSNLDIVLSIPTIYGNGDVTTDSDFEIKTTKKIVQIGPNTEVEKQRVWLETLTYTLEKMTEDRSGFVVVDEGTINNPVGLSIQDSGRLALNVDTVPWVYRISVSANVNGDTFADAKTFVMRDESTGVDLLLFPKDVSAQRVQELHDQYDALEEGAEMSATLASLYPREYMNEDGTINTTSCFYTWELNGGFPKVSGIADVDVKTYCNSDTRYSNASIETQTSMLLNISSKQHDDLVEMDYTMPRDKIFIEYVAQQGSNIVNWKFNSFAAPGSVKVLFALDAGNGFNNEIVFDVSN